MESLPAFFFSSKSLWRNMCTVPYEIARDCESQSTSFASQTPCSGSLGSSSRPLVGTRMHKVSQLGAPRLECLVPTEDCSLGAALVLEYSTQRVSVAGTPRCVPDEPLAPFSNLAADRTLWLVQLSVRGLSK